MAPRNRYGSLRSTAIELGKHGYRVKLRELLPDRLRCPLCQLLMRQPVQTFRGELACAYCYEVARRKQDDGRCPLDGKKIENYEIFRDKGKESEINALDCFCKYRDNDCTWEGKLCEVEDHQETCDFRPVQCYFCEVDVHYAKLTGHLDSCQKWSNEKRCIYDGCRFKPLNSEDLEKHCRESIVHHSMVHRSLMKKVERQGEDQREEIEKSCIDNENKMKNDIEYLKKQLLEITNFAKEMNNKYDLLAAKLDGNSKEMQEIHDVSMATSNGPSEKLCFENISECVSELNDTVSEVSLQQRIFENTSHDGRLVWKIDNFSHRLQQAVIGKVTALHSAPIYTSKYGYKLCARLYLNGDGVGKCSHLSLFIVLMKSEYDSLLSWPFRKTITFRLINQENQEKNIVESFIPDRNSSSWIRPVKQMNVASGCPLFLSQETLLNGNYVKDDSLFIEVSIS